MGWMRERRTVLEARVSSASIHFKNVHSLIHVLFISSRSLTKFEVLGGLVSGTEESRGKISLDRPNRQWDYP
jgi:hypothetical protein